MNGHSASQNFCPSASSQFQQQSPEQLLQVYGYECYGPSIKKIRQRYANRNENSHKLITAINKNCQATEPANARRLLLQLVDIGYWAHASCCLHQHGSHYSIAFAQHSEGNEPPVSQHLPNVLQFPRKECGRVDILLGRRRARSRSLGRNLRHETRRQSPCCKTGISKKSKKEKTNSQNKQTYF